jgi:signal transduction histidine kinase
MMGETVGQRVARVIATSAVLVLLVGSVGVISLFVTTRSVDSLVEHIEPARQANDGVLQDLTDADAGIRGWAISGDQAALVPFFDAMDELPDHQSDLERYQAPIAGVDRLLEDQDEAVDAWISTYVNPRLDAGAGPENYNPALFLRGRRAFEAIRAANDKIDRELSASAQEAREASSRAWYIAVAVTLLAVLLGLAVVFGLGRSLVRGIQRPLAGLALVVKRLAAGEDGVRARTDGLREVAAVGETVNVLAVENERGRAVEAKVHETLRELDRTKNDFVSNVSHELRTPLTSIRGYLELLEDDDDLGGPEREMWEAVNRNVTRLSLLIEDLLTLSKVESRGTDLIELDLRDVVIEVVADLKVVASRRDVDVELEFPLEPLRVLADQTQILRAVLNVASNAVKFSRPGGWVRVAVDIDGDDAVVTVTDNGIGIPEEELVTVGRRFFRGSNAVEQQIAGTGLGIRIVQTIMSRHAGSMNLESVEHEGTTVRLRMPLRGGGGVERGPLPDADEAAPAPA